MRHENFMHRCLELAQNGLGRTYPNPLVGSVIVHQDKIIGEGWHREAGSPHAEVNAVNSLKDHSLLGLSTLYVNLEPCSHFGKTPPCADMIVRLGIPKVVVGTEDPNPLVAGRGIRKLRESGIEVTTGILMDDCKELNRRFFKFQQKKRPYIILKWAESTDGFIAPLHEIGQPHWISNAYARQLVHRWRSEEDAILIGTQTILSDNPKLDVRDWTGKNPVRIVLGKRPLPERSNVLDGSVKTILITEKNNRPNTENLIFEVADFDRPVVPQVMDILYRHGLQSVIVEGGRQTLNAFIEAGFWDEARVFIGQTPLKNGVPAPQIPGAPVEHAEISGDQLLIFRI